MGTTAIQNNLIITTYDASRWIGFSNSFEFVEIVVTENVEADSSITLYINKSKNSVSTGATPDVDSIAVDMVDAINNNIEISSDVVAAFVGNGVYSITTKTVGTPFDVIIGDAQQDYNIENDNDYVMLSAMIDVAKVMADEYCGNSFYLTDADGNILNTDGYIYERYGGTPDTRELPKPVKTGVLQIIKFLWDDYKRASGGSEDVATINGPIQSIKDGDVEVEYFNGSSGISDYWAGMMGTLPSMAQRLLSMYRISPIAMGCQNANKDSNGLWPYSGNSGCASSDDDSCTL